MRTFRICKGEYRSRIMEVSVNGSRIITPLFIPSISSSRHREEFQNFFDFIWGCIPQDISLVSGFDARDDRIAEKIRAERRNGRLLYLDNGSLESRIHNQDGEFRDYLNVINKVEPDVAVAPGCIPKDDFIVSLDDQLSIMKNFRNDVGSDQAITLLFRLNQNWDRDQALRTLAISDTFSSSPPEIVGVTEAELGISIMMRLNAINSLRNGLNEKGHDNVLIHVFGCSDPLSMRLYSVAGADLFDGTGWYRYSYSGNGRKRSEVSHLPLFNCECEYCRSASWKHLQDSEYYLRLAMHNLMSIEQYFQDFREDIVNHRLDSEWLLEEDFKTLRKMMQGWCENH